MKSYKLQQRQEQMTRVIYWWCFYQGFEDNCSWDSLQPQEWRHVKQCNIIHIQEKEKGFPKEKEDEEGKEDPFNRRDNDGSRWLGVMVTSNFYALVFFPFQVSFLMFNYIIVKAIPYNEGKKRLY